MIYFDRKLYPFEFMVRKKWTFSSKIFLMFRLKIIPVFNIRRKMYDTEREIFSSLLQKKNNINQHRSAM